MERRIARMGSLIFGLVFGWTPAAHALIARAMPLKDVLAESHLILMAQVESIDADKPAVVFSAVENLKGKASFKKLPINLTGDSEAKKLKHTPQLLKRLAPKLPLVVFSHGTAGWFGGHHDTAAALADAGFVVAAINHSGDN